MEPAPPLAPAEPPVAPATSLGARLFNVFATPGDVFDEVKGRASCAAHWVLPVLLACLVGIGSTLVIFSQPNIVHQVQEQQERALEKKLQGMSKEQREQVRAAASKFTSPTLLKVFGIGGALAGPWIWLFATALFVWLLGRLVFKAKFGYGKALEICGLAGMIGVLGGIISTLLVVGMGHLNATPGPALLVRDFDPGNKLHLALAACNVVTFWYVCTLAIGLARLGGGSFVKALACLLIPWVVFRFGIIGLGVGAG